MEQLSLQISGQSLPNNAVSQGLECKDVTCVDSLDGGGRGEDRDVGQAAEWGVPPGGHRTGSPLAYGFWLQVGGGRAPPHFLRQ